MQIWVDADACPGVVKEILYRAANRTKINMILVANQPLTVPASAFIKRVQVSHGFDVADNYIVQNVKPHDLVITADIPLADLVIDQQAVALNPRGELYTKENIKQRLATRNFNDALRGTGVNTGGPPKLGQKESVAFANALDKFLTAYRYK